MIEEILEYQEEGPKRAKIQVNTIDVSSVFEFFLIMFDD